MSNEMKAALRHPKWSGRSGCSLKALATDWQNGERMIAKTAAFSIAALMVLTGCQQPLWNKPGATVADFNTDKFQCMQVSQQQTSSAYVNRYGGAASSEQTLNQPLYNACMNSKGWSLQTQSANSEQAAQKSEVEGAFKSIREREAALCADPKFAPYYSKTACGVDKITFDQLADTSKISPAAKAIFAEQRNAVDANLRASLEAMRKYGGTVGAKRADLSDTVVRAQGNKNNLDLYNGLITWGEYNTRRQNIYREYQAAASKITS